LKDKLGVADIIHKRTRPYRPQTNGKGNPAGQYT
jgi:hypothetical protein